MDFNATDIKSFQYVLPVKAGLAVAEKKEMSKSDIENDAFLEFMQAVEKCQIPLSDCLTDWSDFLLRSLTQFY